MGRTGYFFEKIAAAAEEVYQVPIPVLYKNVSIREPLFLDLLVDDQLIIEVKANGCDYPYYEAQLMTHMRLLKKSFGMLINFGKDDVKKAIRLFSL